MLPAFAAGAVIRKSGQIPEHIPDAVGAEPVPLRSDPVTGKLGRRGTGAGEIRLKTRARMSAMIEPVGHRGCGEGREHRDSEKFGRVGICRRFFCSEGST